MQTLKLEKANWQNLLDHLLNVPQTQKVALEIIESAIGAQTQAAQVPLSGLTYDHKDDVLAVQLGGLEHVILRPVRMELAHTDDHIVGLEIVDADERKHLLTFTPPLGMAGSLRELAEKKEK